MNRLMACALACGLVCSFGAAAQAGEIRLGLNAHDALGLDAGVHGKEKTIAITGGYVSERLFDKSWAPRLEIGGNWNMGGKTNFLYVGNLWRAYFGANDQFYIEGSLGLTWHDGKIEVPDLVPGLTPAEEQARIFGNAHYIEYGSRILFREAVAIGVRLTDTLATDIYLEHFSHGKILASGSNEGADAIGLRFSYQLR